MTARPNVAARRSMFFCSIKCLSGLVTSMNLILSWHYPTAQPLTKNHRSSLCCSALACTSSFIFEYETLEPWKGLVMSQIARNDNAIPARETRPGSTRIAGTASTRRRLSMMNRRLCSVRNWIPAGLRKSSLFGSLVQNGSKTYGKNRSDLKRTPVSSKINRDGLCLAAALDELAIGSC